MARYDDSSIIQDKNRERYLSTQKLPIIPKRDTDILIIGKVGQTLLNLANQYYGDVTLWWIISKANGIRGQAGLKPGQLLRIPGNVTRIVSEFKELNQVTEKKRGL